MLLSEAPPGTRPERWRFPARNRIIAALADVVVVVESHVRGGSLHTVDEADRRGRDVFAVPGVGPQPRGGGHQRPARRGAGAGLLGRRRAGRPRPRHRSSASSTDSRAEPDPADREVLEHVGWEAATLDQLVVRTGRDLGRLAPALDRLCDAGWVSRAGGWYERVADQGTIR